MAIKGHIFGTNQQVEHFLMHITRILFHILFKKIIVGIGGDGLMVVHRHVAQLQFGRPKFESWLGCSLGNRSVAGQ